MYVPDLPFDLCSTGSLLHDNNLEPSEHQGALVGVKGNAMVIPCAVDGIGMMLLETYPSSVLEYDAQLGGDARACAMLVHAVCCKNDSFMATSTALGVIARKGTEKQVRSYLEWHARLGCLHPGSMGLTALLRK